MPRLAQHVKPVRAVVGGPKVCPIPTQSEIASSICSTSPTSSARQELISVQHIGGRPLVLNDRRRLLYHPKYCEKMFPNCLCSRTVPVSLLPLFPHRKFTPIHPKMESSMSGMRMVCTNSHDIPLYPTAWIPHSAGAYAGTCISLILVALALRCLIAPKTALE